MIFLFSLPVESRRLFSASFESRNLWRYSKDLQMLLQHKYMDNVTDIGFILWNTYFLSVLVLDSKGVRNTLKRYYVAMERADVVAFTFAMWQIRSCLLC